MKNTTSVINNSAFLFYALLSAVLFSCGEEQQQPRSYSNQESKWVCNCKEKEQLQIFVQNSIKNGNNMSDEEMEDVVKEIYNTGVKIICRQRPVWVYYNDKIDWTKQKFDSCETMVTGVY